MQANKENEMISARRKDDGSYEVINGHMRLKVQLEVHGQAKVVDISTGQALHIHEVDGKMLALNNDAQANVEDQVTAAINRARR